MIQNKTYAIVILEIIMFIYPVPVKGLHTLNNSWVGECVQLKIQFILYCHIFIGYFKIPKNLLFSIFFCMSVIC